MRNKNPFVPHFYMCKDCREVVFWKKTLNMVRCPRCQARFKRRRQAEATARYRAGKKG